MHLWLRLRNAPLVACTTSCRRVVLLSGGDNSNGNNINNNLNNHINNNTNNHNNNNINDNMFVRIIDIKVYSFL